MKIKTVVGPVLAVAVVLYFLLTLTSGGFLVSWSTCRNTVIERIPSPDGRRAAVIYARNCGTTTDFSTQLSVLPRHRGPWGNGNVFVADTDHGKAPSGKEGGPTVKARWLDNRTLEVRYHPRARLIKNATRHDDIDIRYVPDSLPPPEARTREQEMWTHSHG